MKLQLTWAVVLVGLGLVMTPNSALAIHKNKGGKEVAQSQHTCPKSLGCWIWSAKEVEEIVYDVTYEKVKKKICEPEIVQKIEEISCKACQPVWGQGMRTCPDVDYITKTDSIDVETCTMPCDTGCGACGECGGCGSCPVCETITKPKTCITRCEVGRQIPVLEWQLVPQEVKVPRVYYTREYKEKEIEIEVPVMKPRTIKRTVWEKCPAPCECPDCSACAEEVATEEVEETIQQEQEGKEKIIDPSTTTP